MKITVEIGGKSWEFTAPTPEDEAQDELEKERYSYRQLAQRHNDREIMVKAQAERIKELEFKLNDEAAVVSAHSERIGVLRRLLMRVRNVVSQGRLEDLRDCVGLLNEIQEELSK